MSHLVWDRLKDRSYETGTDRGVLYPMENDGSYGIGIAWNGLTAVTENHTGGEPNAFWADNAKYLNLLSLEELELTIEAYSYPREFKPCLGRAELAPGVEISQQKRQGFAFSYRSLVGNAVDGNNWSYKLHLIYGCKASPTERQYSTINESPEPVTLSWEVSTLPVRIEGYKPTSEFVFDGPTYKKNGLMNVMRAIENVLYGDNENDPRIPTLDEIREIYVYERYLRDSDDDTLLDSDGKPLLSSVYD